MKAASFALALPVLFAALAPVPGDDLATKIRSRDVNERVSAADAIKRDGAKDGEKLLLEALGDKDWEVVEHAAAALGVRGSPASLDPLSKLTIDGPVRRVRLAAALAMAKLDPKAAADHLTKAVKGATAVRACEGLATIAETCGGAAQPGIEAGLASKDGDVRAAAAAGLHALPIAARTTKTLECLKETDLRIGAAALDCARAHPDPALLMGTVLGVLLGSSVPEVFEHRAREGVVAILAAAPKESRAGLAQQVVEAAKDAKSEAGAARMARLLGRCAAKPDESGADAAAPKQEPLLAAEAAIAALAPMLTRGGENVNAAAAHALGLIATEGALDRLGAVAASSNSARVRSIAIRGFAAGRPLTDAASADIVKKCLTDADQDTREDAAVALGRPGVPGAVDALVPLLKDAQWEVAVAAAVSLGKTREAAAVAPLQALLASKDWKLKAAALVGLGHSRQKAAVALLIDALSGKSATEKLTAFEFLRRMTSEKLPLKQSSWKPWWSRAEAAFQFPDLSSAGKTEKKYGYAASSYGVYEDLDVLVFQSRGDHIEKLLDKLKVEHRTTRLGEVANAGLSPHCVYVANCTGECQPEDLEQVQWFVHAGGYLFSSCWGLTHQAGVIRPGFARKFETGERDVLGLVTAEPCAESPYLAGVFDGVTRPKYVLEGAHLIEVLDPERVEVLIDSPECAKDHSGGGNLAAWWTIGHGLILDSVNHFDLQGFDRAPPMKEAAERMAYAVDVMGLSFSDLRDVPKGAWNSQTKAAEEVRDFSAFRFITNFVRARRRSGS